MFVLLTISIVVVTYFLWTRRDLYKLSWQLPGPFALPIIGNATSLRPNMIHPYLDQLSKTYESPMRVWLGPMLLVFIADAENVEILLKSKDCLNKPDTFYKMIRDAISGDGLFTSKEEEWKVHRRLVSPTINQPSVSTHLPIFNKNIRQILPHLPTNDEFFDILPLITKCKMTIFVEVALGTEWESDVKEQYLRQLASAIEIVSNRTLQPMYHIDFIWRFTEAAKRLSGYNQNGRKVFEQMLSNALEKGEYSETILGRLIDVSEKNPNFTKEDIFAETATILTGASDTSSVLSAFVTLMLAIHPKYQEKVFQEIVSVMPNRSIDLTQADLEQLEFTNLCIKETLRLFPTAPLIGRAANKPIKLSNGITVPANVPFLFGLRQIHIQERYFGPTANIFNPYRFLDKQFEQLPSAAYIPFSYGPRNCIGYHYANVSVKCFVAHLIRNYRVTTNYTDIDQLQLVQNASLKLIDKHMVKLEPRSE